MSMHRWLIGAGATLALAACGSPTDATSFQAPPGYVSAVSIGPFMQVWRGPQGHHTGVILMALPGEIAFSKITENSNVKDAKVLKSEDMKICNGQDAYYVSMTGEMAEGQDTKQAETQQIDVVATHLNGKTYMAMYVREKGAPTDPSAETAIRGICPKV
jgi:hypothetical protein